MIAANNTFKINIYAQAIICCLGFMLFSFFIHFGFPLIIISFAGLALPAVLISIQINSTTKMIQYFGLVFPKKIILYMVIGLQLGLIYALVYRSISGMEIFPRSLTIFTATAAMIGATEELIFRGFIQDYFKKVNVIFAVLFATFSHTAYKCCLFFSPASEMEINVSFLFIWTFIGGLIFGILKEISKSVIPAMLAHVLFDILVYGECFQPPWWVW